MKKNRKSVNWLKRYEDKKFEHEKKRELVRKRKRIENERLRITKRRQKKFTKNPEKSQYKKILVAQKKFSLIENPSDVIEFTNQARLFLHKKIPIVIDLSEVEESGVETLTYLIALITDQDFSKGTPFSGNIPKDETLSKMYMKSGFYNFVKPRMEVLKHVADVTSSLIHQMTSNRADSELAAKLTATILGHTLKITDEKIIKKDTLTTLIIECMSNTSEHSNYGTSHPIYNWWVIAYKEKATNITKFCLLDLGVGIFGSLRTKYQKNMLTSGLKRIFNPNSNPRTLSKIFKGEIRKSSTRLAERGLGLRYIHDEVKKHRHIKNFVLLSNDTMAVINPTSDKIQTIKGNFNGTMYYWEVWPTINEEKYHKRNNCNSKRF